jgi:organic radical activating enzyme
VELIIKPTSSCNFNCSFCAASDLTIKHSPNHVPDKIKETILALKPDTIIVTGGEPLCCSPEYYNELLQIYDCNISLTTNLKDFYLHPDKWSELFKNPCVHVCTSFNYGNTRCWSENDIYTEEKFKTVMNLFKDKIGYMPLFLAVIDNDNEDTYLKHVHLAKELGTTCRLNNALKIGRQGKHYPRYKIFQKWLDIIEMDLEEYEMNCSERKSGRCPINTNLMCSSCIRSIYLDVNDNIRSSDCEDKLNKGIENEPINKSPITDNCVCCELYRICNGCDINREEAKVCPEYCFEMLKLKDKIINGGWRL